MSGHVVFQEDIHFYSLVKDASNSFETSAHFYHKIRHYNQEGLNTFSIYTEVKKMGIILKSSTAGMEYN
jgi:hypothetical protein